MSVSSSAKTNQGDSSTGENRFGLLRNSDRIKIKFGNYGIDIIENEPSIRVSSLYSLHDGVKINRTFAVVAYPDVIEAAFKPEHEAIINGQSIGIVFAQNGWAIDKQHQYFGEIEVPPGVSGTRTLFSGIGTDRPAIHIYSLLVNKGNSAFEYALIAEVHHPDFLQLDDLVAIYGQGSNNHLTDTKSVNDFLDIVNTKIQGL